MKREISAMFLKAQGYNPENTFAVWDFKSGRITEREMWSILNKNMFPGESVVKIRRDKPRKGEAVTLNDTEHGKIMRVQWEDGRPDTIYVVFSGGRQDMFDYELFEGNYSSKGGKTHWYIYDEE